MHTLYGTDGLSILLCIIINYIIKKCDAVPHCAVAGAEIAGLS